MSASGTTFPLTDGGETGRSRTGNPFGSAVLVLLGGAVTTALALVGVWFLNARFELNVMGWYLNFVIPAGALAVGMAASSGYAMVCLWRGVKVSTPLLLTFFGLQCGAYFAAQYVEFSVLAPTFDDGSPIGFWTFFDLSTRAFAWASKDGTPGTPLEGWGYALRTLELLGFGAGSLVAPLGLSGKAYCEACSFYMRSRQAVVFAASVPTVKFKKTQEAEQTAHETEQKVAWEAAMRTVEAFRAEAEAGNATGFRDRIAGLKDGEKQAMKLPQRVVVYLARCPGCETGELRFVLHSGQGEHQSQNEISRAALAPHFVRTALG